jgi:hypothetical protein
MGERHTFGDKTVVLQSPAGLCVTDTGWKTWNAALVCIEYLKCHPGLKDAVMLDLSSGNGLLALAAEQFGVKRCVASEIPSCVPLIEKNVSSNESVVIPCTYSWGQGISGLITAITTPTSIGDTPDKNQGRKEFDLVVMSDLVYIAFRDSIEPLFLNTILALAPTSRTEVVFCYEERLLEREAAFLAALEEHFTLSERALSPAMQAALRKADLSDPESDSESNSVGEGEGEEEGGRGVMGMGMGMGIFYQQPPVRLIILRRKD